MNRTKYRVGRICPCCRCRNTERGQRGDRLMHYYCRKLLDAGWTMGDVREARRQERLLAVIPDVSVTAQARIARDAGMDFKLMLASLHRLIDAGKVERLKVIPCGFGRPGYVYRRLVPVPTEFTQEAA